MTITYDCDCKDIIERLKKLMNSKVKFISNIVFSQFCET